MMSWTMPATASEWVSPSAGSPRCESSSSRHGTAALKIAFTTNSFRSCERLIETATETTSATGSSAAFGVVRFGRAGDGDAAARAGAPRAGDADARAGVRRRAEEGPFGSLL